MVGWLVGYPSVGALGVVQLLGSTAPVTRAGAAASFEKLCSASNPNLNQNPSPLMDEFSQQLFLLRPSQL